MKLTEDTRLLAAVLEAMQQVHCLGATSCYIRGDRGVCHHVRRRCVEHHDPREITALLHALSAGWPAGSGSRHYPIPATYTSCGDLDMLDEYTASEDNDEDRGRAMYQYEGLAGKWKGAQLELRLAFLTWCIAALWARLGELQ